MRPNSRSRRSPTAKQLLHLVFGGELKDPGGTEFVDTGSSTSSASIRTTSRRTRPGRRRRKGPSTMPHVRYFVVHLHRLLDPEATERR